MMRHHGHGLDSGMLATAISGLCSARIFAYHTHDAQAVLQTTIAYREIIYASITNVVQRALV